MNGMEWGKESRRFAITAKKGGFFGVLCGGLKDLKDLDLPGLVTLKIRLESLRGKL
ncbi:hypothetical protein QWJ34_01985 [Saccharibacillus sp. CPCC 101409]|uniref:hypothetical protein n=1 Tax=Saccharibacillus sp. CPCC 101409 TaxID=3058041 RepID=UPI0026735A04|nr:hypothetical protein [Saccharibacillus sp. CPCC 101409]MDO3408531.1 hypothetical protein [Saccharibacillus sp. CPCC 101409]